MTERVDVVIVGSGFGGSITAWRLAELYRAAGTDPRSVVVLERGVGTGIPTSANRWTSTISRTSTCSSRDRERRSSPRTPSGVVRTSISHVFARRARRSSGETADPATDPRGGCGHKRSRASPSTPITRGPSRASGWPDPSGIRCRSPAACGRRRSTAPGVRATACRSRSRRSAASTPSGVTRCSSVPRLITNYLAAAEAAGVQVRPDVQVS